MKASLLVDAPILEKKQIWVKKVNKPFFDHNFHFHKTEEICWIEEGSGNIIVGDFLGRFEENDLIIFGMGLPHILRCDNAFHQPNSKKHTIAHSIYFTEAHICSLTDDPAMLYEIQQYIKKAERGYQLNGKEKATAIELLQKVIISTKFEQLGHFLRLLEFLHGCKKCLPLASSNFQLNPSETEMKRFTEVYDYLLKNFQQHISLAEVASICSMTTNAFCRFFKKRKTSERKGFEPMIPFRVYRLSRSAPSTTRPPLRPLCPAFHGRFYNSRIFGTMTQWRKRKRRTK